MVDRQQIMDAILGLTKRPEWTERQMDPERAKIDLILCAVGGKQVTVAGMARRWGMPRTTARRVIQTACALVPWLAKCLDSPHGCPDSTTANVHQAVTVDMNMDSLADMHSQPLAGSSVFCKDTIADMGVDSPGSDREADQRRIHGGKDVDINLDPEDPEEIEGMDALERILDALPAEPQCTSPVMGMGFRRPTVTTPEAEPDLESRARELARQSWKAMPDSVKARVGHDFEEFWKTSSGRFLREAAAV